jgi:hypothetical protein
MEPDGDEKRSGHGSRVGFGFLAFLLLGLLQVGRGQFLLEGDTTVLADAKL